jgi:hypothetical protein
VFALPGKHSPEREEGRSEEERTGSEREARGEYRRQKRMRGDQKR